jgi:GT2 family glycosyltransferase
MSGACDPRVAVVVATRNRARSLARTLDRLRALPERPRVLVVDNGSSDGTVAVARTHGADVIGAGRNLGAAARALAARALDAPYVAFADDDSWWAAGALSRGADLLDRHDRLGLIAARILVGPEHRLDPVCESMARSPLPPRPDGPGIPVLGFVACGAIVRRSAFLAAGGFHERIGIGGEEALLAIDLASRGWELRYVPELVAHHDPHPGATRSGRAHVMLRNALWTEWLRRPRARALGRTLMRLASGGRVAPGALAAALRGLPWVLRERHVLPCHVEAGLRAIEGEGPLKSAEFAHNFSARRLLRRAKV